MSLRGSIWDLTRGKTDTDEAMAALAYRSADLVKAMEHLSWVMQTFHQAYHTDQKSTWANCPKPACEATAEFLQEIIK